MKPVAVTVLGVGNLRCGPQAVAACATHDGPLDIRLFEANEERLDLMDRFARVCIDAAGTEPVLRSTSVQDEALEGATHVVFCLNEDGARRMVGQRETETYDPSQDESAKEEFFFGDLNKPTPRDKLSAQTQAILSSPAPSPLSREEAISEAVRALLLSVPRDAKVLSLMRGVLMPEGVAHTYVNWPGVLTAEQVAGVPHQLLRWILGESSIRGLLDEARASTLAEWLQSS